MRKQIDMAQTFRQWVEEHEQFELMAPVPFSLVCFRYNDGRGEEELNQFNEKLLNEVNNTGEVFLTHTSLRGKYTLRMAIGQRTTQERHVKKAWDIIVKSSERLSRE